MTLLVDELGYVAMGTPDLEDAAAFFVDVGQLEVSERRDDVVFLRGDDRHHWLRLERQSTAGVIRVGYQVRSASSRDEIVRRLDEMGVEHWSGTGLADDRVVNGLRFHDPNGIEIELYEEMVRLPTPRPSRGIDLQKLLHAVFMVDDVVGTRDFWREVLDFRRSDQIEELACFMRCGDRYHHSVGFLRGQGNAGRLDHFCILVPSVDDVMRMRNVAVRSSVPMEHEAIRHAASGSISTYLQFSPLDLGIEYCSGHAQLDDDDPGRLLIASPATLNVWNALPPSGPDAWTPSSSVQSLGNVYETLEQTTPTSS